MTIKTATSIMDICFRTTQLKESDCSSKRLKYILDGEAGKNRVALLLRRNMFSISNYLTFMIFLAEHRCLALLNK